MKLVEIRISDRRILKLVRKWLGAGVMEEGSVRRSDLGTPQGGVISPLLANIYLNYFDLLWERHGNKDGELTRYADDLVVICKTKKDADLAFQLIQAIMERLELTLHPTKTRIAGLWTGEEGFDFLGMHHQKTNAETSQGKVYVTTQQWLSRKAEERIRGVVKERLAPPNMRHKSFHEHLEYMIGYDELAAKRCCFVIIVVSKELGDSAPMPMILHVRYTTLRLLLIESTIRMILIKSILGISRNV